MVGLPLKNKHAPPPPTHTHSHTAIPHAHARPPPQIVEYCDGGTLADASAEGELLQPDGTPHMVSSGARRARALACLLGQAPNGKRT